MKASGDEGVEIWGDEIRAGKGGRKGGEFEKRGGTWIAGEDVEVSGSGRNFELERVAFIAVFNKN